MSQNHEAGQIKKACNDLGSHSLGGLCVRLCGMTLAAIALAGVAIAVLALLLP